MTAPRAEATRIRSAAMGQMQERPWRVSMSPGPHTSPKSPHSQKLRNRADFAARGGKNPHAARHSES
eukprot:1054824-Prymnesium_polylepis.1